MGLDYVEYIMDLENHFGIRFPDEKSFQCETMGDLHQYLVAHLPHLSPDEIWKVQVNIVCEQMGFDELQRMQITPRDHLIRDLNLS